LIALNEGSEMRLLLDLRLRDFYPKMLLSRVDKMSKILPCIFITLKVRLGYGSRSSLAVKCEKKMTRTKRSRVCFLVRLISLGWSGLVWSGLVWSGLVWSGLVWSGLVWSGLVFAVLCCALLCFAVLCCTVMCCAGQR
jgi:hypothetical protein